LFVRHTWRRPPGLRWPLIYTESALSRRLRSTPRQQALRNGPEFLSDRLSKKYFLSAFSIHFNNLQTLTHQPLPDSYLPACYPERRKGRSRTTAQRPFPFLDKHKERNDDGPT
jgi:hypothetical protein